MTGADVPQSHQIASGLLVAIGEQTVGRYGVLPAADLLNETDEVEIVLFRRPADDSYRVVLLDRMLRRLDVEAQFLRGGRERRRQDVCLKLQFRGEKLFIFLSFI